MTDLTMTPRIVNLFLTMFIVTDILISRWSIFTTFALVFLIGWNGLLFYLTYLPQPEFSYGELKDQYPEIWQKLYFQEAWVGFWEINDKGIEK